MTSEIVFILFTFLLALGLVGSLAIHHFARRCAKRRSHPGQFEWRRSERRRSSTSSLDFPGAAFEARPGSFRAEFAALAPARHRESNIDISWERP